MLAKPLLHRGEILHRLPRLIARELLGRVLELLHLLHELGGERLTQQLLRFVKLSCETAVERTRLFELLLERRRLLLQILHAFSHRPLLFGDGPCLLGGFVAHRALLSAALGVGGRAVASPSTVAALAAVARRVVGALLERALRGGSRLRFAHGGIGGVPGHCSSLFHRRDLENQLAAFAPLRPGRVVDRHDLHVERVTSFQLTRAQIESCGAVPYSRRAGRQRLSNDRLSSGVARLPTLQLDVRDAMIVADREAQRNSIVAGNERVGGGRHELHAWRRVGIHFQLEGKRDVGDRSGHTERAPAPLAALPRLEAAREGVATGAKSDRLLVTHQLNGSQFGRRAAGDVDDRTARHARRLANGEALRCPSEVRGVCRPHRDRPHERPVCHAYDRRVRRRPTIRDHEREIATYRSDDHFRDTGARHLKCGRPPAFTRRALHQRHHRAARRRNLELQRLTAHDLRRKRAELDLRQERAAPGLDWKKERQ